MLEAMGGGFTWGSVLLRCKKIMNYGRRLTGKDKGNSLQSLIGMPDIGGGSERKNSNAGRLG